ncbi:MAG TPA: tetratricopeptide repeat protein [Deltaproteobacteria bacterium]|jgi:TPR repeat protein|nr:sel1 repeat family protein [Deltaproteobacteria bacterium]HRW81650.1 tetratricopeptide repeat protein [Desulfomonilia bacterium]NMD39357.1 sel1 repeat family protein [Deltaproteobacteria bacterium]HON95242.1 tetratricopeptide repeat protein [Deltaproteobacteria bacterium]HPR03550.1 tetratricopeptide repeat protein [Deltaproteobacteria bacterium]
MRGLIAILSMLAFSLACFLPGIGSLTALASDEDNPGLRENLLPAQQGDAKAQLFVAYLYETGQGVKQNYAKAAQWYGKAARQGNPEAQTQLGDMYRQGKGVPQNYVLAYMWLDLASQQGSRQARELKKNVSSRMTAGQKDEAKKLLKNWKAKK